VNTLIHGGRAGREGATIVSDTAPIPI